MSLKPIKPTLAQWRRQLGLGHPLLSKERQQHTADVERLRKLWNEAQQEPDQQ